MKPIKKDKSIFPDPALVPKTGKPNPDFKIKPMNKDEIHCQTIQMFCVALVLVFISGFMIGWASKSAVDLYNEKTEGQCDQSAHCWNNN